MGETDFRQAISSILGNENIYFYWKGRVALYALIKAMKVGEGDEVILPGYTCVVVPNAIKYLGAKPVYIDVDKTTMNPSLNHFSKAITPKTKILITQNTFGLSTQVDEIAEMAKAKGIYSIEDCTHGFGGTFKGKPNGSYCDAAFFSTQWNKPFSTGIGGFATVNNVGLLNELEKVNRNLVHPTIKESMVLSALLFVHDKVLSPANYWQLRSLYRWLSKNNLVVGSSEGQELKSVEIPKGYFKGMGNVQFKKGTENVLGIDKLLARRKRNAESYTDFLVKEEKYYVEKALHQNHSFLKYPILVKTRGALEEKAINAKIDLGDWFCTPLYPIEKNFKLWDLDIGDIPVANYLSKQIVNLPTDSDNPQKVIDFLKANINEII
jgi:dTDP-4-amino-4,6-dideoxygalactose transaminase